MTKTEPSNYVAEMEFVKSVMHDRGDLIVGYVPYGHVIHLWSKVSVPLCGSRAGRRNRKRATEWSDGICRQCLRVLHRREQDAKQD